ncbi:MAG: triose-phosphate isomerase [Flavobacteriales bacterium CG_4_9_14_3_um_filter_32_8]|nr:MAG: triose-phosphate isomerase [Flavobacteriales bacterium CG_4_9_14_3_um_filter_32_8]
MRKKIVAGNWKMNKSYAEAIDLINNIINANPNPTVQLIVFPPAIYATELVKLTTSTPIKVGVQNSSQYDAGAYTGEIAASMLKSVGVQYALVGHSERRHYFNEQNSDLALKVNQLLKNEITPIYCCGEILAEREKNNHFNVVKNQISEGLFQLTENEILKCIIAYEPVWAIGTGVTASAAQAQEMHLFIRNSIVQKYGNKIADQISILYGGSCNAKNAKELFSNQDVDGGLIGGASLNATDFIAIANSF